MALAVRLRANNERDAAIRLESDFCGLIWLAAGGFQEAGDAKPAQHPATLRAFAAAGETGPVCLLLGDVQIGDESAAVDQDAERAAIRERRDQVAPAKLERVHAELRGRAFDQALGQVIGLGLAGAAIGVDRHRVGSTPCTSMNTAGIAYGPPIAVDGALVEVPGPKPAT